MSAPLAERIGVEFPVFVRKLDRKSVWGGNGDAVDERVAKAASGIFPSADSWFSFYRVASMSELGTVVVALNAYRDRLSKAIDLIAVTPREFELAGIEIDNAAGQTDCALANKLHVDVGGVSNEQFSVLCQEMISAGRPAFRVGKVDVKKMVASLETFRCHAVGGQGCQCLAGARPTINLAAAN